MKYIFDNRVVCHSDIYSCSLTENLAIRIIVEDIATDGTQLADERESLSMGWGFVTTAPA